MPKGKVTGKLPAMKIRSLYHRPTEQHRDQKVYRRKGREAQRILREYQDCSLLSLGKAA